MRHHHGLVRTMIALFCAISISTSTIAEEALPVVQPKRAAADVATLITTGAALLPDAPTMAIPTEPLRDFEREPMTLAEAARANDYAAFDAAYRRANDTAAYAELHALWTFSVTDPIGGFYGDAMHDRLARAYPRYAAYIEDFRIVDRNGNVFYPSAETRAFLTEQAIAGVLPVFGSRFSVFEPKRESVKVVTKPQPKPAAVAKTTTPAPAPVVETPATPIISAQPAVPVAQQAARKPETENRKPAVAPSSTARGLLLIIIGLLGIGALTMMLRTPAEDLPSAESVEPPVVPFKTVGGEPPAEPRATGSHG